MNKHPKSILVVATVAVFMATALILPRLISAGELEPSAPPGPTMKTLDEIPPTWSQKLDASERFELVLDGAAVLDKETGLVWEQSPDTTTRTWTNAIIYCYQKTIGGRKGWRLPTVEELASLVDPSQSSPALPSGHPFSSSVQSAYYWSSTTSAGKAGYAWGVGFNDGGVKAPPISATLYVWCVRGGQGHDAY